MSLNLLVGYTGLLSAAHAAFYGLGAYASALILTKAHLPFIFALCVGIIFPMIVAVLIGIVLSRFKDDYYVLASLGLNVIVSGIILNAQDLTNGSLGIAGIMRPKIFGFVLTSNQSFLIFAFVFLILTYLLSRFIARSSFGRALKAIREDEKSLSIFGYKTHMFKLVIFVITAGLAGLAGVMYASYITFIDPATFIVPESIFVLSMIILGGLANTEGAIIGALFLIILPEALRFVGFPADVAGQLRQVVYGVLLVLFMLFRPQGIRGEYKL